MKHTEENILKQKALDKRKGVNTKSGCSTQTKLKTSSDTKVDTEETKNTEGQYICRETHKIQIPSTLKKQLVDDWELITQQNKRLIIKLPRSPTIDDIFTKYLEYRSKKDCMLTDSVGEILNGLRCYFDKALRVVPLYKKECQQYDEAISANVSPSSVYVKLPDLLAYLKIEDETQIQLQQKLLDFLKFLQKNKSTFFLSAYDSPKVSEGSGKGKEN